jgi:hypothetical protein
MVTPPISWIASVAYVLVAKYRQVTWWHTGLQASVRGYRSFSLADEIRGTVDG